MGRRLIIMPGMARSGTTAIQQWLEKHPGIHQSRIKEPNWLIPYRYAEKLYRYCPSGKESFVESGEYLHGESTMRNFGGFPDNTTFVDASTMYFSHAAAFADGLRDAKQMFDDVRLVIVARDAFNRALSHFNFSVERGEEQRSFEQALSDEVLGKDRFWSVGGYAAGSNLTQFLTAIEPVIDERRMKIIEFETLCSNTLAVEEELSIFLDLPQTKNHIKRANQSHSHKSIIAIRIRHFTSSLKRRHPFVFSNIVFKKLNILLINFLAIFSTKDNQKQRLSMRAIFSRYTGGE